jgi:hypothetical protein
VAGLSLAVSQLVDRAIIATAEELFGARHFSSVVALATDALEAEPGCVPMLILRARAHIALRRDIDAQSDLRKIIQLDGHCAIAYRLLGELAARRDENESAGIFFRESMRLDPRDREAREWLQIVESSTRPSSPPEQIRFARGTQPPMSDEDERPTARSGSQPLRARGSEPAVWKTPEPVRALPLPPPPLTLPVTLTGRPPPTPPSKPAQTIAPTHPARSAIPELPGFGDYLVSAGILTRERLRAAQAYQRSMKVQLSTAIVTLGLATPQRIEWAAVSHQSELGRQG